MDSDFNLGFQSLAQASGRGWRGVAGRARIYQLVIRKYVREVREASSAGIQDPWPEGSLERMMGT